MSVGNFDDFFATLTSDKLEQIVNDAKMKLATESASTDHSDLSFQAERGSTLNQLIFFELLDMYHKWLEQQS